MTRAMTVTRDRATTEPAAPPPAVVSSVADWTAGYEAGWTAGYHAARTALDDAAAHLVRTLRPSEAVEVAEHRRRADRQPAAWRTPTERDAYRARVHASWGLTPPDSSQDAASDDTDQTEET